MFVRFNYKVYMAVKNGSEDGMFGYVPFLIASSFVIPSHLIVLSVTVLSKQAFLVSILHSHSRLGVMSNVRRWQPFLPLRYLPHERVTFGSPVGQITTY